MQGLTPFNLSISRYKEVQESKHNVIYYTIEMSKKGSGSWKLDKRFKEFDELNNILKKSYANLPHFPQKTFFHLKEGPDLEKRRQELEHYLQVFK